MSIHIWVQSCNPTLHSSQSEERKADVNVWECDTQLVHLCIKATNYYMYNIIITIIMVFCFDVDCEILLLKILAASTYPRNCNFKISLIFIKMFYHKQISHLQHITNSIYRYQCTYSLISK